MPPVDTNETLDLVKAAFGGNITDNVLAKGITQALGLVAYDLQAPAVRLQPVITPLRNKLPRVAGGGDTATRWKTITGVNTSGIGVGVSEGNRGGVIATTVVSNTAAYAGLGLEDFVTFEANYAAKGFEDVKADATLGLLQSLMIGEENVIYGGNASLALGITPTPTLSTATTGGAIAAATVVSVIAVALSHRGFNASSVANGVVGQITRTNADGSTDTYGGGAAQKSTNATVTVGGTSTNTVSATIATPVQGAVGYAWFAGVAGSERLVAITTINSVVITSLPGASQLASALTAADYSQNALNFDGLLTIACKAGSNAYVQALPTGAAGVGTPLTSDGAGGIAEFSTAFGYWWDNYRMSPDTVWLSGQEIVNISKKIVANGGAPLIRFTQDPTGAHLNLSAGAVVGTILNPYTQTMVKVAIHPNATKGTALFTTDRLPYPVQNIGNVMQIKTRQDYYQLEWPLRSRKYEYGVYADEVLQHFATFALGVIFNIANG